jgi:DNA-binding transcriptional ArsR family regulator
MAVELKTHVFASVAHEMVTQIMAVVGKMTNLEVGDRWHQQARSKMSPQLRKAVTGFGPNIHGPWGSLTDMTYANRWVSVDELLRGLESLPEKDLILQISGIDEYPGAHKQLDDLLLQTAAGDKAAARELVAKGPALHHNRASQLARWLPRVAPRLRASLIEITSLWRRDLFGAEEERLATILERDAKAKVALARRLSPAELLEEATNGFVWVDQPGLDTIALLPTWVMRPWTVDGRLESTAIISYPVADESLGGNGNAIAARAVKLARVLADESRVRALQLMAEEPMTIQELADKLGLRKSTVHHHIAELRAAGLLRVPMATKRYSLRPEALDRFGAVLAELAKPARMRGRRKRDE